MEESKLSLLFQVLSKFGLGFTIIGVFLFACAGTMDYLNAWLFLISLMIPMACLGVYLFLKDVSTLKRRLDSKEPEKSQRVYITIMGLLFLLSFMLAGFDYRFQWSKMPIEISLFATIIMLLGYALFCIVLLQNSYASRVVAIQDEQRVIETGLYAWVRHPMYTACLMLFFAMPIILGSYWAVIPMLVFPLFLLKRAENEEEVLLTGLPGYKEYMEKVKKRFIPFIW